eukprot:scaffold185139_cov18-Tisochrysis_lutea.AAC.1
MAGPGVHRFSSFLFLAALSVKALVEGHALGQVWVQVQAVCITHQACIISTLGAGSSRVHHSSGVHHTPSVHPTTVAGASLGITLQVQALASHVRCKPWASHSKRAPHATCASHIECVPPDVNSCWCKPWASHVSKTGT